MTIEAISFENLFRINYRWKIRKAVKLRAPAIEKDRKRIRERKEQKHAYCKVKGYLPIKCLFQSERTSASALKTINRSHTFPIVTMNFRILIINQQANCLVFPCIIPFGVFCSVVSVISFVLMFDKLAARSFHSVCHSFCLTYNHVI